MKKHKYNQIVKIATLNATSGMGMSYRNLIKRVMRWLNAKPNLWLTQAERKKICVEELATKIARDAIKATGKWFPDYQTANEYVEDQLFNSVNEKALENGWNSKRFDKELKKAMRDRDWIVDAIGRIPAAKERLGIKI